METDKLLKRYLRFVRVSAVSTGTYPRRAEAIAV